MSFRCFIFFYFSCKQFYILSSEAFLDQYWKTFGQLVLMCEVVSCLSYEVLRREKCRETGEIYMICYSFIVRVIALAVVLLCKMKVSVSMWHHNVLLSIFPSLRSDIPSGQFTDLRSTESLVHFQISSVHFQISVVHFRISLVHFQISFVHFSSS